MNYRKAFFGTAVLAVGLSAALVWFWIKPQRAQVDPTRQNEQFTTSTALPQQSEPSAASLQPIQLSPQRLQSIGVRFAEVVRRPVRDELRVAGNVQVNEERLAYVQTRFPGWIQKVFANATYKYVSKGQPLFTIYSQDLVSTEQEFLLALKNRQLGTTAVSGAAQPDWLLDA